MYHKEKLSFLWYKTYSSTFPNIVMAISIALLRARLEGQAGGSAGEREL